MNSVNANTLSTDLTGLIKSQKSNKFKRTTQGRNLFAFINPAPLKKSKIHQTVFVSPVPLANNL